MPARNSLLPLSLLPLALLFLAVPFPAHAEPGIIVTPVTSMEKPPTCKAWASRHKVYEGQVTTVVWKSKRADEMRGLISRDTWEPNGHLRFVMGHAGTKPFLFVFTGPGGSTSCSFKVQVLSKRYVDRP